MRVRYFCLVLLTLFSSSLSQAKALLISDIDDTLKVAHVQDLLSSAVNAFDDKTRFAGMSELYQDLQKYGGIEIAYISRAPEWLMKTTHQKFLVNGNFPEGRYIGRRVTDPSGDDFKLKAIRNLVEAVKPTKVILVGDNGERDPAIYGVVANEMRAQGIEVLQFIRVLYDVYTDPSFVAPLEISQVGFVTPVEIALEVEKAGIIDKSVAEGLVAYLSRKLIKPESQFAKNEVMFTYFQQCMDYTYPWGDHLNRNRYILHLVEKIEFNCGVDLR